MIEGHDIICISTTFWQRPWGSRQQIMSRLATGNRVLFVEYQISFLHFFRYPVLLRKMFTSRIREVKRNIVVYTPLPTLPFRHYSRFINMLDQLFLLFQLRRLIKKLGFSNVILWTFDPTSYPLVGRAGEKVSIYHCADAPKNEKRSGFRKKNITFMENELCKRCDVVFAITEDLLAEKSELNDRTYLVPSAANEVFLRSNGSSSGPRAERAGKGIVKPVIGFVGTLDHRIDHELIDFIAEKLGDWSMVIVGEEDINREGRNKYFTRRKNVHLFKWVEHDRLPSYIDLFDVSILPYKVNEFTRGISPIKVFEYLARGKPVVTSDLPGIKNMRDKGLVKTAHDKRDFVAKIKESFEEDTPEMKKARVEFAGENTWADRVERVSGVLERFLGEKERE